MSLKTEFDKLTYDTRMLDINLNNKTITPSDVENHISQLEDCSDNATQVNIDDKAEAPVATEEVTPVAETNSNIQQTSYGQFDPNKPLG